MFCCCRLVHPVFWLIDWFIARDMRPDEGQTEYEEVQKELSSKEEELQVIDDSFTLYEFY